MATYPGFLRFQEFAMDSNTQPSQDKGRMHLPQPVNYPLSPPEESAIDSFSTDASPSPTQQNWSNKLPPIQLGPSPPTSPQMSPLPRLPVLSIEPHTFSATLPEAQDPLLFAQSATEEKAAPLFGTNAGDKDRIDSVVSANSSGRLEPSLALDVQQPVVPLDLQRSKVQLTPIFFHGFHAISERFATQSSTEAFRSELEDERREFRRRQREAQEPEVASQLNQASKRYDDSKKRSILKANTGAGVCKPQSRLQAKRQASPPAFQMSKPTRTPKPTPKTVNAPRRAPKTPANPKATALVRASKSLSIEPQQQPRKRAPASKAAVPKAEDQLWASQPDYCPPTSTLDGMSKTLRVTWKSPANDLSHDPVTEHMHPQEVEISSALKLPGVQYMANKRRIFAMRLQCLQLDQPWGKTKAQNACNIDVNKTSQMYEAFDRVGWFERKHFTRWLN